MGNKPNQPKPTPQHPKAPPSHMPPMRRDEGK